MGRKPKRDTEVLNYNCFPYNYIILTMYVFIVYLPTLKHNLSQEITKTKADTEMIYVFIYLFILNCVVSSVHVRIGL